MIENEFLMEISLALNNTTPWLMIFSAILLAFERRGFKNKKTKWYQPTLKYHTAKHLVNYMRLFFWLQLISICFIFFLNSNQMQNDTFVFLMSGLTGLIDSTCFILLMVEDLYCYRAITKMTDKSTFGDHNMLIDGYYTRIRDLIFIVIVAVISFISFVASKDQMELLTSKLLYSLYKDIAFSVLFVVLAKLHTKTTKALLRLEFGLD